MKKIRFPFRGTVAYPQQVKRIDTEKILKEAEALHDEILSNMTRAFTGISVVMDSKLEGYRYYLCVSQKLYERLKNQAPAAAPDGQKVAD